LVRNGNNKEPFVNIHIHKQMKRKKLPLSASIPVARMGTKETIHGHLI